MDQVVEESYDFTKAEFHDLGVRIQGRPYDQWILAGLQTKPLYEGTVPYRVKLKRRRRNKVARISRRINRG